MWHACTDTCTEGESKFREWSTKDEAKRDRQGEKKMTDIGRAGRQMGC